MRTIVVADALMGVDNVLGVAAVAAACAGVLT
jgi:predicted tellurium resistance membrane protein TerC